MVCFKFAGWLLSRFSFPALHCSLCPEVSDPMYEFDAQKGWAPSLRVLPYSDRNDRMYYILVIVSYLCWLLGFYDPHAAQDSFVVGFLSGNWQLFFLLNMRLLQHR